ncbi:MAG: ACP S-malonyltransferase, partial [Nitrosopumilus sp.]|nr:ACP S-malonyltransferase [Nitrosopumilus sp.]
IMFTGTAEELKKTNITQAAIFLHSVIKFKTLQSPSPDMVAGHSLGEFSALVANNSLSFKDGLQLVIRRANAMQKACEENPSGMAAILGLDETKVEKICNETEGVVAAANYNSPGQLVISGETEAVNNACESLKAAGAKRAIILSVGGAFHSPLMETARLELRNAIYHTVFKEPDCPIYQNVTASAVTNADEIRKNLVDQLTSPVKWTQTIQQMVSDGATKFVECGPGKVLQGLVKKISPEAQVFSA